MLAHGNPTPTPVALAEPTLGIVKVRSPTKPLDYSPSRTFVEVVDVMTFEALEAKWQRLAERAAEPNIFQDPRFLAAGTAILRSSAVYVLLAWTRTDTGEQRLTASWALRAARPRSGLPAQILVAPPLANYAFLGGPVVDKEHLPAAIEAMLNAIAAHPKMPKIIEIRDIKADGPTAAALRTALIERGTTLVTIDTRQRPILSSTQKGEEYLKASLSAGTRKKLRQHRRRLAAQGKLEVVSHRGGNAIEAFARFAALEHASWKGRSGTAILSRSDHAAFAKAFIDKMANAGLAWVEALHFDGRIIAAQVILRSGNVAFTWKIAHDDAFAEFSPGVLLMEDYTGGLLCDSSLLSTDSCCFSDEGIMGSLWRERANMAEVCFDVRRGGSYAFQAVVAADRAEIWLRTALKRRLSSIGSRRAKLKRVLTANWFQRKKAGHHHPN